MMTVGELRRLVPEEDRLAQALVLVVVGERHQRMLLGHVRRVAHAVDRAGRHVDEPPHAGAPCRDHHRLEAVVVDRPAQGRVELEARIVRDAGQVNDAVDAVHGRGKAGRVADVAANDVEIRMRRQTVRPEEHQVVDDHRVPRAAAVSGRGRSRRSLHRQ